MDLELERKIVIVTGGANGIGRAITETFAKDYAHPIILDQDRKSGKEVRHSLLERGMLSDFYQLDLTDYQKAKETIKKIVRKKGRIDVLVNNAGTNRNI